jgi:ABC-type transporter Mla MlaB component
MNEQIIYLSGDFDAEALVKVRAAALEKDAETPPITLDFRDVRSFQPFALAGLFELISKVKGQVKTRSLTRQQEVLLGYLGLSPHALS